MATGGRAGTGARIEPAETDHFAADGAHAFSAKRITDDRFVKRSVTVLRSQDAAVSERLRFELKGKKNQVILSKIKIVLSFFFQDLNTNFLIFQI